MDILTKEEFESHKEKYLALIEKGAVFVYPTDTIYGIGCDATNTKSIQKIRQLKGRETKPFSIIAPSKEWIKTNCIVSKEAEKWLLKLPGPYTLILQLRNRESVTNNVTQQENTIGVRIPDHWIREISHVLGIPIITTSVNIAGNAPMTSLDDMENNIKQNVDFIIDEGKKDGKPSTLVYLHKEKVAVKER